MPYKTISWRNCKKNLTVRLRVHLWTSAASPGLRTPPPQRDGGTHLDSGEYQGGGVYPYPKFHRALIYTGACWDLPNVSDLKSQDVFMRLSSSFASSWWESYFAPSMKDHNWNMAIPLHLELVPDAQTETVARKTSHHIQLLGTCKIFLKNNHLDTVIHALVTSQVDNVLCGVLYVGLSLKAKWKLQWIENEIQKGMNFIVD